MDMEQKVKGRDPVLMATALYDDLDEVYHKLELGDIVLVHRKKGFYQRALKWATGGSYWAHMALVFDVIETNEGHREVIIIEALDKGIEIHRLHHYLIDLQNFDLGFKRLPDLTKAQKERIRGFFLDALDTPYNFASAFGYIAKKPVMQILGMRVTDFIERKLIKPSLFVCTSFAQRAFYMALPPNERHRALFIPDDEESQELNFLYQLSEITPQDVARSKNTQWLYNVHY